jgi:hypothetical protein
VAVDKNVAVGVGIDVVVSVGVDEDVAAGPPVARDVGVTVSGRAEWLLPPTGGNYDVLGTDRGDL